MYYHLIQFVMQVLMLLDSFQKYQLNGYGHEFYRLETSKYLKDMSILGRSDSYIVVVDLDKQNITEKYRDNCIEVDKFVGSGDDELLNKLTPFLIHLSGPKVKDVRKEIQKYGDKPLDSFIEAVKAKQPKPAPNRVVYI